MKKVYIKPNVTVVETCIECILGNESGQIKDTHSKEHNSFFDGWDSFDEEEQSGFTNKSLWED